MTRRGEAPPPAPFFECLDCKFRTRRKQDADEHEQTEMDHYVSAIDNGRRLR